jgi:ferredoxin-NADP reductase
MATTIMATPGKKSATAMADGWQQARISRITTRSPLTKSFHLALDTPWAYLAGQHCSIRLTAPNGYQATRDYSLSSAPQSGEYEITIVKAPHGEMSGWFLDTAEVGDTLEILGPIGKHFIWSAKAPAPATLIAGGVGVTPLMSILREHRLSQSTSPIRLFYSARTADDLIFREEVLESEPRSTERIDMTLAESAPEGWRYRTGLITKDMLAASYLPGSTVYVCGPNGFVEAATRILTDELLVDPATVKTERFG